MLLAAHRRALTPFSRWKTGLLDMTAEPDGRNRWCVASPAVPRAASGPFRRQQWLPLRAALACVARCDRATSPDGAGSRRGVPFGGAAFAWRLPVPVATPAETHVSRTLAAADAFTHGAACTPSRARRALTAAWPRTLRRPRACPARCVALHPSMRNTPARTPLQKQRHRAVRHNERSWRSVTRETQRHATAWHRPGACLRAFCLDSQGSCVTGALCFMVFPHLVQVRFEKPAECYHGDGLTRRLRRCSTGLRRPRHPRERGHPRQLHV
jgi:hypothetical protein